MPGEPVNAAAINAKDGADRPERGLKKRLLDEVRKFLVITLYIWVMLALFSLHKTVVLEQSHLNYQAQGFAIFNALVLAKIVLIADDLHLGSRFGEHPLIYSVLYRSFLFAAVLICFHILEGMVAALWQGRPLSESLAEFGRGDLRGVLSIGALVFVAFIPFFMFREAADLVGGDQLWRLFFDRRARTFRLSVEE